MQIGLISMGPVQSWLVCHPKHCCNEKSPASAGLFFGDAGTNLKASAMTLASPAQCLLTRDLCIEVHGSG